MRARTLILFLVAILLAGGTAMLVRSWLAQQRTVEAEAAPTPPPALPQKSSQKYLKFSDQAIWLSLSVG